VLRVVGRRPGPGLADWLGSVGGVELHTDVPSVDPFVTTAAVSINPMRSGSGVNIKMVAAMAAAAPVVSTRSGSRGLDWEPGTHLLVADEPAEFAVAVSGLLEDPARAEALGRAGRAYVLRTLDHATLLGRMREQLPTRTG
jgi:glycosyltransferase involved in cell wall biosynthesis